MEAVSITDFSGKVVEPGDVIAVAVHAGRSSAILRRAVYLGCTEHSICYEFPNSVWKWNKKTSSGSYVPGLKKARVERGEGRVVLLSKKE